MRVLIVEDDLTYGRFQEQRLLQRGRTRFSTTHVTSLEDALGCVAASPPDVVVLDLNLPDARGAGAVRALHLAQPDVPIVVVSGTLDADIEAAARMAGATDVTQKGQDNDEGLELRLLAAAYRKAYARIQSADPVAPVARRLVMDIAMHLRGAENIVKAMRAAIANDEQLDKQYVDDCLERLQEALAPMQPHPTGDVMMRRLDPKDLMLAAADHVVELAIYGDSAPIMAQPSTMQRALCSIFSTLYLSKGPVPVEMRTDGDVLVIHIAATEAMSMRREHPLLWTMANDLLALSMAVMEPDETGFTVRCALAPE